LLIEVIVLKAAHAQRVHHSGGERHMPGYARKEHSFAAKCSVRERIVEALQSAASHCNSLKFEANVPYTGHGAVDAQSVGNRCDALCGVSMTIEATKLVD
jgi:hypothetical protein